MEPTKITVVPVHPCTNVRVLQNELWLMNVTDEYLADLDKKRIEKVNPRTGEPYGKPGGLLRRKKQIEVSYLHKKEIQDWRERTGFVMPHGAFCMWFYTPMPPSWRKWQIEKYKYTCHQSTPDIDNYAKQVFDAIMPRRNRAAGQTGADDRKIHCYATFKVWVPYDEACIKIVHYDQEAFSFIFRHGHPNEGQG